MYFLKLTGEFCSHNPASLKKISNVWKKAFEKAAHGVKNDKGEYGSVEFITASDYRSFRLKKSDPVV